MPDAAQGLAPAPFIVAMMLAAALVSALLTWLARGFALRRRMVDEPGRRRSHAQATPRGGGVGFVLVAIAAAASLPLTGWGPAPLWLAFALGSAAVAVAGGLDDVGGLRPRWRFAVHLASAAGYCLVLLGMPGSGGEWALLGLAVLYLAGLVNAWNFIDGIDGIAASQGLVVAVALACLSAGTGAGLLAWTLAGGLLGFLPFNMPRARIFMGDVGSGTLGFALGALALQAAASGAMHWLGMLVLVSACGIDTALTLVKRILQGKAWWSAHREHLYQWLVRRGSSHFRATASYFLWTATVCALFAYLALVEPGLQAPVAIFVLALAASAWFLLRARLRMSVRGPKR
ncbi:MraY family glycosyltransferase [Coralloluteibacterium stylophorae]|nr:glycosyltransferase family 4 protein [Coralloluteibacterium stylophorae]